MQVKNVQPGQTFETSSGERFRMIKKTKKEIFFENIVSRKLHRQTLDVATMDVVIIKYVVKHT
jgi:hypothetical protein